MACSEADAGPPAGKDVSDATAQEKVEEMPKEDPTADSGPKTAASADASGAEGQEAKATAASGEEDAAAQLQRRIQEACSRGEAPIRPENLLPPQKRSAPEPNAEDGRSEPATKRGRKNRGQNKAKDRVDNMKAFKAVRDAQLCAKLAYLNKCPDAEESAAGTPGRHCKHCSAAGTPAAVLEAKPPAIAEECPVLRSWGVCPAGMNSRFGNHIVDGKNVDREGIPLTPDSAWTQKIPGVGHPKGETNVFEYPLIRQLRSRSYDFSRSAEVTKDWSRYQSGATEKPLGSLADCEPKPLDLAGKTLLAPLTTVGNLPFRRLCVKLGVDVTVGEMALSNSIIEGGPSDLSLLRRHESEKCFGVQIAGGDVEVMAKTAQFVDEHVDCDFLDINCGCPLDEIHRKGAGTRLMSNAKRLEGVVRCMSSIMRKPLTVKLRTAHFEDAKSKQMEFQGRIAHQLIPRVDEWGASAVILHGRTARQRYTKLADWDYIHECSTRRTRSTPFVGVGDVLTWEDAEEHRKLHGVDAIMVARGALIKPWIFTEIKERRHWDISGSERFDMIRDFTNFGLEHWGSDSRGVENTRRFLLEWLSFTCRYVPIGLLEAMPPQINWRPRPYFGRSDIETKLASTNASDWVEITEMLLGKVPDGFSFTPKHKSNAYETPATEATGGKK